MSTVIRSRSNELQVNKITIDEQPDVVSTLKRRRSSVQRHLEQLQKRFQHLNSIARNKLPTKNSKYRRRLSTAVMENTMYSAKDSFTIKNDNNFAHNTTEFPRNVSKDFLKDLRNDFVPSCGQGDETVHNNVLYSDQNLLKRESLKFDKGIRTILEKLWYLVDHDNDGTVRKTEYYELHRRLLRALVGVVSKENEVLMCDEDWIQDIGNVSCNTNNEQDNVENTIMTKKQFINAFFRMVDLWTEKICVDEYFSFLSDAFNRISVPDGNGGYKFKDIDAIQRRSRRASMIVIKGKVCLSENLDDSSNSKKIKKKKKKTGDCSKSEGWWCRLYGTGPWWERLKGVKKVDNNNNIKYRYARNNLVSSNIDLNAKFHVDIIDKKSIDSKRHNIVLNTSNIRSGRKKEYDSRATGSNLPSKSMAVSNVGNSNTLGNENMLNKYNIRDVNMIQNNNNYCEFVSIDKNYSSKDVLQNSKQHVDDHHIKVDVGNNNYGEKHDPTNSIDNKCHRPDWSTYMRNIYETSAIGAHGGYKDFFLANNHRSRKHRCVGGYVNRLQSNYCKNVLNPNNSNSAIIASMRTENDNNNNKNCNSVVDILVNNICKEKKRNRKLSLSTLVEKAELNMPLEPEINYSTNNLNGSLMKLPTTGNVLLSDLQVYDELMYGRSSNRNRIQLKKLIVMKKRRVKSAKGSRRKRVKSFLQISGRRQMTERLNKTRASSRSGTASPGRCSINLHPEK
jgi:hypothetical protein